MLMKTLRIWLLSQLDRGLAVKFPHTLGNSSIVCCCCTFMWNSFLFIVLKHSDVSKSEFDGTYSTLASPFQVRIRQNVKHTVSSLPSWNLTERTALCDFRSKLELMECTALFSSVPSWNSTERTALYQFRSKLEFDRTYSALSVPFQVGIWRNVQHFVSSVPSWNWWNV